MFVREEAGYVAVALVCTLTACYLVARQQRMVDLALLTWSRFERRIPRALHVLLFPPVFRSPRFARLLTLGLAAFSFVLAGVLWVVAIGALVEYLGQRK